MNFENIEEQDGLNQVDAHYEFEKIKKIKKDKKSIFRKKVNSLAIINNPSQKFIYKLSDCAVIHEELLRNPETSYESLFMSSLYFKKVSSLHVNQNYLTMNIKPNDGNYMPINYLVERFRSFQDKGFKEIADIIELFDAFHLQTKNMIQQKQKIQGPRKVKQALLQRNIQKQQRFQKYLQEFTGKSYFAILYTDCEIGLNLSKIVVSLPLMNQLGINLEEIVNNYIKYKKVFFEILSTQCYKNIFSSYIKNGVIKKLSEQRKASIEGIVDKGQNAKIKMALNGEVYRKKYSNELQWQQKVKCNITLNKPRAYITVFEITNIQDMPIKTFNHRTNRIEKMEFDELPKMQEQLQAILGSSTNCFPIQNDEKQSFEVI